MNRHQVLTGAANNGDHCYAVGSVEGIHFTAYAAGCNIVILASDFQRVQIIPGVHYGSIQVSCIDCCTDTGKIAAAYGDKVYIFEPTPLVNQESSHKLDYEWYKTGQVETDYEVHALSWNEDGSRLLTGGSMIQIWNLPETQSSLKGSVEFFIEGITENDEENESEEQIPSWICLWQSKPSNIVYQLKFSSDGLLFASAGDGDRLVKVWYENKKIQTPLMANESVSPKKEEINYSFVYIAHPRAVTGFAWRKTSKYMPRGSVANMLITSCKDNICRIWCETILPEDGLVDLNQLDPHAAHNPGFHTQRHKKRFMQRLHHIRQVMHKRKRNNAHGNFSPSNTSFNIPNSLTVHDYHKFGVHPNSVAPGFHFHLAASINPESDIPLIPSMGQEDSKWNFVVHWLDNKELHFTLEAEKMIEDLLSTNQDAVSDKLKTEPVHDSHFIRKQEEVVKHTGIPSRRFSMPVMKKHQSIDRESVDSSSSTQESAILPDPLDSKIEHLLRDWHHSQDVLFSIHPVDGSFLVWIVDWLDEYEPGLFRQAQISFSSHIPKALPVGDAMTMAPNVKLYCNYRNLNLKAALKETEKPLTENTECTTKYTADAMGKNSPGQSDNTTVPNVLMLSKHNNGSLNLWQISLAEASKFAAILSIAHASRVSGHRFHTNIATCHPVLPLLLTTSHHNIPDMNLENVDTFLNMDMNADIKTQLSGNKTSPKREDSNDEFCSELILWQVGSVGPLSKSGGITELARINFPNVSAFTNVAWLPTLLPSSTLGSCSNSPSALFIAYEGLCLKIYQAVIDARSLIHDFGKQKKVKRCMSQGSSNSSSAWIQVTPTNHSEQESTESFKIVSQQSTERPGCIIERESIEDTQQEWGQILLMHVFQDQLIMGPKSKDYNERRNLMEAHVDLQDIAIFEEHFFLVVVEKLDSGQTVLHMWKIMIASQGVEEPDYKYSPDVVYTQEEEYSSFEHGHIGKSQGTQDPNVQNKLKIMSEKICSQLLEVPEDVVILNVGVAAGHLSSSSIYPACFAPYLISTGCSDGRVRFWKCEPQFRNNELQTINDIIYKWMPWEMMVSKSEEGSSEIKIAGKPVAVNCAYSGRVAVAYKLGGVKTSVNNPGKKFVNYCVSIYECESTGGSEWTLEDTIELKHITLPDPIVNIDMSYITDEHLYNSQQLVSPTARRPSIMKTYSIPSPTTIRSIKKTLSEKGERKDFSTRPLVQLDWVGMEDGSHILTIAVGSKIDLYAAISGEMANVSRTHNKNRTTPSRGILQKSKSMTVQTFTEEIRWIKIRSIDLDTADKLPPFPMHISWVRDGVLVVGMDNEMHVYSQWRGPGDIFDIVDNSSDNESRETNLKGVLSSSSLGLGVAFKVTQSVSNLKISHSISTANMSPKARANVNERTDIPKSDSNSSLQVIQDCGLFEAARIVNPVLPQYHPKQLLELLNFGKIRRVKAILAHLVRCISGKGIMYGEDSPQLRHRCLSVGRQVAAPTQFAKDRSTLPEDINLDYIEISSIPPLPLYALLIADIEPSNQGKSDILKSPTPQQPNLDYSELFNTASTDEDTDDPFTEDVFDLSPKPRERRKTISGQLNQNYFGPSTAALLTKHLTHTRLPGLSSLDQMYLLALADTVANTKTDFADKYIDMTMKKVMTKENNERDQSSPENVDDCGLRYHLAARHYVYLLNTLPLSQRAKLQLTGLKSANFVWAYHSESEEELLNILPAMAKGQPTWAELKQFGVGWWLKNLTSLRRCMEKVAKHAFQSKKDPLDAALFYLAMKKKNVLWGLFRSVSDTRMEQFFKNNFKEERWRKAALKNAFVLLGKQRFQHAAAFFLLADAVRDAIEVCLNKLDDLQLAMVVAKLYDSELDSAMPLNLKKIVQEEILGYEPDSQNYNQLKAHNDPFTRSIAFWMLKDYSSALGTLLDVNHGCRNLKTDLDSYSANPSVFNFYNYLRTHPMLVRQQLAVAATMTSQKVMLSGFIHVGQSGENNIALMDKITPLERKLFFTTAHAHFKSGCPMLALEVLSKLPDVLIVDDMTDNLSEVSSVEKGIKPEKSAPGFKEDAPRSAEKKSIADIDWGAPVTQMKDNELELDWSDDDDNDEGDSMKDAENESDIHSDKQSTNKEDASEVSDDTPAHTSSKNDIMAQQLKFIACMKILMEELSTLATGFEVDGGQLRFQLYIWLEKEVEVLKSVCNYGSDDVDIALPNQNKDLDETGKSEHAHKNINDVHGKPTLHEIILAEKLDFENKQARAARRKKWLKGNQQLLRTLLSYSVLHGSGGGGLASVRMELLLLLQELQQERTQQQLLSPLPFPTTLPLLSASVASAKTAIADPIRHLQNVTRDILHTVIEFRTPPTLMSPLSKILTLRSIITALSACIYQALCDSDNFVVAISDHVDIGMEGFTSTNVVYKDTYLMAGAQRKRMNSSSMMDIANSNPAKWPGVSSLRALLAKECDEDSPRINIQLCESLIAVYMSLLVYGLSVYDCNVLYRLVAHTFKEGMWPALFGGGMRKLVQVTNIDHTLPQPKDDLSKQRMKLHMKVLAATGSSPRLSEDKPIYKEKFVPPEVSMISYFMTKPYENPNDTGIDYDSTESMSDSEEDEEDEEEKTFASIKNDVGMTEHVEPQSYSWSLMRFTVVKHIKHALVQFLPQVGIELPELPMCSPLLQSVLKTLEKWEELMQSKLDLFSGPPVDYIPGCYVDTTVEGSIRAKYKTLLEPENTPFISSHPSALPAKRLWHYLVKNEFLQETFIRYIFKKKKAHSEVNTMKIAALDLVQPHNQMKIIHKEQDAITSFCINQANLHCVSVATPKEIIEMDMTNILNPPAWLYDETEYDIENMNKPSWNMDEGDFLFVQTPNDGQMYGNTAIPPTAPGALPAPSSGYFSGHTGRGAGVIAKRKLEGIRKMGAHPHLPYYLTGAQDGSACLWEWSHDQTISVVRNAGSFPKVTKVLFNAQGNKFGVSDSEGCLCLWQVGLGINMSKPYLNMKCHSKQTNDFVFVGSSSLLATAGHSSENRNVCLWDTLLPQKSSLVQAFHCHSDGSPAILYAPQHQILISGGKAGEVSIFDVRQRQIRHSFQAHDSAVRCMALDPLEQYFVTGSADGDIKVWGLTVHNLIHAFHGEHSKGSLFRNIGAGVMHLYLGSEGQVFSCGTDGTMKYCILPTKEDVM